ncbi:CU044_2847 family protein [Streptomyces sp. NPDC058440]|uniref:CU044_2847 family protein n=1 Tax=Streptomyces sp. NPDC058440 TaxID=3346501 RepID=UPI00365E82AE
MAELMRFGLESGGTVVVEVDDDEPGVARASRATQAIRDAGVSFRGALSGIRGAAASALDTFRGMPHQPDEITVEFGIRLNAEAGAVIARTGTEGHLQVTLTWKHQDPAPD